MAGKVLEIQNLANADSLASSIGMMWDNWFTQRSTKTKEWKELRNFLFATDITTTSVGDNTDWKNKTTIPKLTQIRDNLHANYRAALFSNPEWLKWEGSNLEAVTRTKAQAIEAYMHNKIRTSGFEQTVEELLYDYIDYGNVFAEVIFVREYKVDALSGQIVPGYIGPKLRRISPLDHLFNPTAPSYRESPKLTRYVKTIGELHEESISRPDLMYIPEAIQKAEEFRNSLTKFKSEDVDQAEAFTVDGFGSLSEYYNSGYVELIELKGDVYDPETGQFLKNQIITIMDRKYVLRKVDDPSWTGYTQQHISWRQRPDNLYGMGPLDNLVGLQYRLDHLENLKADAIDLTIHPPVKIVGDVPPFAWGPEETIFIPDGEGDVIPMPPNAAALTLDNEIQYLMAIMDEMAGSPKEAMGVRTPGEKTAFEVQQLQNAAGRIFQDKISRFEKYFLEPLLNSMLEVGRRNMDGNDLVRVMDDDLGVTEFITLTRDDITAEGKLYPVGARHFASQAQFVQNMNGIFNSAMAEKIAPHISGLKLAQIVEEIFGIEKYNLVQENIAIIEQGDTARLAQTVQDQVQAEGMTETEPEV